MKTSPIVFRPDEGPQTGYDDEVSMRRGVSRLLWLVSASLLGIAITPVRAECSVTRAPDQATPAVDEPVVVVAIRESAALSLTDALQTAQANLALQGITLRIVALPPEQRAATLAKTEFEAESSLGVFWFDERDPHALRVVLATHDRKGFLRTLPLTDGDAEEVKEAVWLIVESSSLALSLGHAPAMEAIDPTAFEAPPVEPEPSDEEASSEVAPDEAPPTRPPAPSFELHGTVQPQRVKPVFALVASYLGEGLGTPLPWQHGVDVGAVVHTDGLWKLAFDYSLLVRPTEELVVGWQQGFEARGGLRTVLGQRVELHALVGAGVRALQWKNTQTDERGWRALATFGLDAGLIVGLSKSLSLWLEPGLTVAANRFTFTECSLDDECAGAGRRVVLDPWPVQPRIRAGIRVRIPNLGDSR